MDAIVRDPSDFLEAVQNDRGDSLLEELADGERADARAQTSASSVDDLIAESDRWLPPRTRAA